MSASTVLASALHNAIVAPYILHYGTEEQKKKWLPKLATGELIGAIAMTEPGAGSDLQGVKTRAEKDGNHYMINGSKTFITNGQLANLIIVVAKTDPDEGAKGISLIVVETDERRGLRARPQPRQDRPEGARHLRAVLQRRARADLQPARRRGRPGLRPADAAAAAGAPADRHRRPRHDRGALALTIDYVKERKAFGKPIIDFQNTQFKLAELKTEATVGRVFYNDCVARYIAGGLDAAHRLDGEVLAHRPAVQGGRRVPAALRRLWLHERIPDRAACSATRACSASTAAPTRS